MEFFTKKQKDFINLRTIKEGSFYMFPRFGFNIYSDKDGTYGEYMDTNPFTKSLDNEYFMVKNIEGDYIRGNFYKKPLKNDFYLCKYELQQKDIFLRLFLFVVLFIPFTMYTWFIRQD